MLSVDFAPVFVIIGAAGAKLRCGNAFNILSLFQCNNTEFKQESHSAGCVGRLSSTAQLQYCLSDEAALARIDMNSFSIRSGHDPSIVWPATHEVSQQHMHASVVPVILDD